MSEAISRELLGKIVDEVFDGAIEDASVIEDIYAAIKRHEAQHKQSFFAAEGIPADIDQIATDIVRADYTAGDEEPAWIMCLAIAKAILAERDRHPPSPHHKTTGLNDLIEKSKAKLADMSEEERQAMWQAQRKSFVRAMTTPCEHGVLDFEQCPQCRAPAPAEHVGDPCPYCRSGAPKVSCPCHRNQAMIDDALKEE